MTTGLSEDREQLQRVFTREAPALARTVRALLCSPEGVEDVVQEVFVVAFGRIGTFEGRASMASWLRGIAVNVVRNRTRRRLRRDAIGQRRTAEVATMAETPEATLAARRLEQVLWNAVDRLPHREREAFVLRVLEERSLAECALALGISVKAVSRRAVAAERKVKAAVEVER